jgi:hypothetical protein
MRNSGLIPPHHATVLASGPTAGADTPAGGAALRTMATDRLRRVLAGDRPEPVDTESARAMAQVAFASRTVGLVHPDAPTDALAPVYRALLSHPDLPTWTLDWIAQDPATGCPEVLAPLLEHPNTTQDVILRAAQQTLWGYHGAINVDEWTGKHPLAQVLRRCGGLAGRVAAALIPLWAGPEWGGFVDVARRLCGAGDGGLEVFLTLAADTRTARGQTTYQLPQGVLEDLCRRAELLGR